MNFKEVYSINVNEWTEKKNNSTYLSWAHAWKSFMEVYPTAKYEIVKDADGTPVFGNSEIGYMCYTRVTVEETTHEMWLPVMDFRNKAIKNPDMFDVNKTIMRCLTKNLAMFGLGLYIYAGEDIPNDEGDEMKASVKKITLDDLLAKAESKGVTKEQLIEAINKGTPEKEHITDVKQLKENQIIGLNKKLDLKK